MHFRTDGLARPSDVLLGPYYMAHHRNALVYLDRLDEAQWAEREAVRDALEARTVDRLLAGDDAAAHAHRFDSFGAPLGRSLGRPAWTFRDSSYAYLSFELEPTGTGKPLALRLSVFAERDAALEVVVNGTRIEQTEIKSKRPHQVEVVSYSIPEELTRNGGKLRVWLLPPATKSGPVVFGASLLRAN